MSRKLGQWMPNQSGNPSGRSKAWHEARKLAQEYTPEAIQRLAQIMRQGTDKDAMTAAIALLDRAWGKPAQEIQIQELAEGVKERDVSMLTDEELEAEAMRLLGDRSGYGKERLTQ